MTVDHADRSIETLSDLRLGEVTGGGEWVHNTTLRGKLNAFTERHATGLLFGAAAAMLTGTLWAHDYWQNLAKERQAGKAP